ncbi:hypothetical protein ACO2Q8_07740 [Larkinella sp. VNQ87]|uniref:hypothetical protein n=1 Tax=Larkinella sp. VNQ87 TaxID=3400921 RepID=UPI003C0CC409
MNDFLHDPDTGDLVIKNGDLVVGDATDQHHTDIVIWHKGWNHFDPTIGVGLSRFLLDEGGAPGLTRTIRAELERDGNTVDSVSIEPDAITIIARYE